VHWFNQGDDYPLHKTVVNWCTSPSICKHTTW